MEEILQKLGCIKPCLLSYQLCRISAINSIFKKNNQPLGGVQFRLQAFLPWPNMYSSYRLADWAKVDIGFLKKLRGSLLTIQKPHNTSNKSVIS